MPIPISKCAILVPVINHIESACERGLQGLEKKGYHVRRLWGHSDIARGRSMIATRALDDGYSDLLWIDSDIAFDPDDVDRLRANDVPIVGGIYPQKGVRRLTVSPLEKAPIELTLGKGGGLLEVGHIATGFLLTRRPAYDAIKKFHKLPLCDVDKEGFGIVPYYLSLIVEEEGRFRYLSEDYSFCKRARLAGLKVYADTSIRLGHVGSYEYHWEDAGMDRKRYATFKFKIEQ